MYRCSTWWLGRLRTHGRRVIRWCRLANQRHRGFNLPQRNLVFNKLNMPKDKKFVESHVETEEGTLSERVPKKYTWTRFGVEFVLGIRIKPRITKTPEETEFGRVEGCLNNFSYKDKDDKVIFGIQLMRLTAIENEND